MKLYLDTGNIEEVRAAAATGLIDGVTTNPSLIAKEHGDFAQILKQLAKILDATGKDFTLSAEVTAETADEMLKQGIALAKLDKHVIVKVPLTQQGLIAARSLAARKIRTNVTLCFSANQALLAAKADAWCVSPFVGRLDDAGEDGIALVRDIRAIYDRYGMKTKILAASIRSPLHVQRAALAGADIATVPSKIFTQLFEHPLTAKGLEQFAKDWQAREQRERGGAQ